LTTLTRHNFAPLFHDLKTRSCNNVKYHAKNKSVNYSYYNVLLLPKQSEGCGFEAYQCSVYHSVDR